MTDEQQTCRGVRDDGQPCEQSEMLDEDGLCPAHREGARERLREAGRRGGEATARRHRSEEDTLESEELGQLESHSDAKARLDLICRAVLTGRIGRERADPSIRAIREWVSAHQAEVADEKLAELERRLAEIEAGGRSDRWGPGA